MEVISPMSAPIMKPSSLRNSQESRIFNIGSKMGSYVWLSEEESLPHYGRGIVCFEAKALNDIHVSLNTEIEIGTVSQDGQVDGAPAYEVVIGGWMNSKTAIRKKGKQQAIVTKRTSSVAVISPVGVFSKYWLLISNGKVRLGKGDVPGQNEVIRWKDPVPENNVKYIGFSSWDTPIQYRNVRVVDIQANKNLLDLNENKAISSLLDDSPLSDLILMVQNQPIHVHKAVLGCASDSLWKELQASDAQMDYQMQNSETTLSTSPMCSSSENQNQKSSKVLKLDDVQHNDFLNLLIWCLGGHICGSPALMELGERFQIPSFLESCNEALKLNGPASSTILTNRLAFQRLWDEGTNTPSTLWSDVTIRIGDELIVAHKIILSIKSSHFFSMFNYSFKESRSKEVELCDLSAHTFKLALRHMYTSNLFNLSSIDEAISLFELSERFHIPTLANHCQDYLRNHIEIDNSCEMLSLAQFFSAASLHETCMRFVEHNFTTVAASMGFLQLEGELLMEILMSDTLLVTKEEQLYDAVISWWKADKQNRGTAVRQLLACLRFPLMDKDFLEKTVLSHDLFRSTPPLADRVEQALKFIGDDNKQREATDIKIVQEKILMTDSADLSYSTRPRRGNNSIELFFSHCGDENGVFYYMATNGKSSRWVNPHRSNQIRVTCSSPVSRYTKPEILVGRAFVTTSFTKGNPAWWCIDLNNKRLICNYYSLQTDGSDSTLTSWTLQGSNDQVKWFDLRVHKENLPSAKHSSWPVYAKNAYHPYRFFRVTALPATGTAMATLALCGMELYGYLMTGVTPVETKNETSS